MTQEMPENAADLSSLITSCFNAREPLELLGGGSRRSMGPRVQAARCVTTSALNGIELYKPNELVLSAKSGTPVADIHAVLDEKSQRMTFEPPDYRRLLGTDDTVPTLGGLLATNAGGPARLVQGAIRDVALGIEAVNGQGEIIRSGGRVMKNVTGYDLPRLLAGSWGGLAAMTQVTIKVLPKPPGARTLIFSGEHLADLLALVRDSLKMPMEVQAASVVDRVCAQELGIGEGVSVAMLRLEGDGYSLDYRQSELQAAFPGAAMTVLSPAQADHAWSSLRDGLVFADSPGAVWRISLPPASADAFISAVKSEVTIARCYGDWAGGLVWLQLADDVKTPEHEVIRRHLATQGGGHATLMRSAAGESNDPAGFEPLSDPIMKFQQKIMQAFDPGNILNPGRQYSGL